MIKEKQQALDNTRKELAKRFGEGITFKGSERKDVPIICSSGSIKFDSAIGVGGIPKGRIIEIYGPEASGKTTTTLHIIREAQKIGDTCAFVDAEHALDPVWATNIGVNMEELIISQPDCGEDALEVVEALVKSKAVSIIVVDSVASLTPRAEIEGNFGDSNMGLHARLMSQAMRKLTALVSKSDCTIIFINQIRMKIGVMFGCFSYDTPVNFTDGRSIPIGKVVDEEIKGDVYCYNEQTGTIEEKPIIDWHDNGVVEKHEDFIHIQTASIDGKGRFGFTCTPNHKILTEFGWKEAKDLSYNDKLVSKYNKTFNKCYEHFINGIVIGDSHISVRSKNTASLRIQDNENIDYINWKLDKLSPLINFTERKVKQGFRYDSEYTYELKKLKENIDERNPYYMLERFTPLSFALWIMDDGYLDLNDGHRRYSISIKRFKNQEDRLSIISNKLCHLGYMNEYSVKDGNIKFKTCETDKIAKTICKYVPECMSYKLPEEYRDKYEDFNLDNSEELVPEFVSIKEIRYASDRQMRNKRKFDISVKDNHNYMVGGKHNGVIVHNSPETTTGGEALKFYASIRAEVRRQLGDSVKNDDEGMTQAKITIKIVKNKVAPPFKKVSLTLNTGKDGMYGYNIHEEVLDEAVKIGIITKGGAWYSYKEEKIGQGKAKAIEWLQTQPELYEDIKKEVIEHLYKQDFVEESFDDIISEVKDE